MSNKNKNRMLSEHFSLEEMTYSRIAVENGIDNAPSEEARGALKYLATTVLEPLRNLYNGPIAILSGYRSEKVNRLAGGVKNSQHLKGEAVDCYVTNIPLLMNLLIHSGLPFDQAIHYRKRNFLHLSLKVSGINRMQVLIFLLCLVFLLPGCGSRRRYEQSKTEMYTDTVSFATLETVRNNQMFHLVDTAIWQVRQVVYSPPDSAGQQYPQRVVSATLDYRRQLADTTSSVAIRQQMVAGRKTATASTHVEKQEQKKHRYYLIGATALFILITLFLSHKKS